MVVKRSGIIGGPVLIQIHGTEVAIGRGMARRIFVAVS
jgi:Fe2+ transport system protein FeoA